MFLLLLNVLQAAVPHPDDAAGDAGADVGDIAADGGDHASRGHRHSHYCSFTFERLTPQPSFRIL